MNKIDRILRAIEFKPIDRIPKGEFYLEDSFIEKFPGLQRKVRFRDRVEACERCGLDAVALPLTSFVGDSEEVWKELMQWRKETDFFIFGILDGPFQGSAKQYPSFTDYMFAIAQRDSSLKEYVNKILTDNIEVGRKAIAMGVNGIIVADDIAYGGGTIISPTALREYFFPGLKEQVGVLKGKKTPVIFHADGDILSVLQDLMQIGFNGLHSLNWPSYNQIESVSGMTEHKLCLMGGYDLSWFQRSDRLKKAEELLKSILPQTGGTGYVFGSSAGILGCDLEPEQVLEVYRYINGFVLP